MLLILLGRHAAMARVTPYMGHERESAREVTMCHRRAVTGCPTTSRICWTIQVINLSRLLVK